jgi:hypothetical protein
VYKDKLLYIDQHHLSLDGSFLITEQLEKVLDKQLDEDE